jgi:hypothetical protein
MFAVTPRGRIIAIEITAFISLVCMVIALTVQSNANRLAVETPVVAKVAQVWSRAARGGPVYRAHLIFDRKQSDGQIVHCDVPRVDLGARPPFVGGTIKIYPRAESCWEPDVVCETCMVPSGRIALSFLTIAVISGFCLCFFVTRRTVPDVQNKVA